MIRTVVCVIFTALSVVLPMPALAQAGVASPFLDAAGLVASRGGADVATLRLRFDVSSTAPNEPSAQRLTLDLAPDWALATTDAGVTLHDFRLGRTITVFADEFLSESTLVAISETREKRAAMRATVSACDADSGVGLSAKDDQPSAIRFVFAHPSVRVFCNDIDVGGFVPGIGQRPPASFWPALAAVAPMHPALLQRIRLTAAAPSKIDVQFDAGAGMTAFRLWRLTSSEIIATPYPVTQALAIRGPESKATQLPARLIALARAAVAGTAQTGAPTLESWSARVAASTSPGQPPEELAMLSWPTFAMFPQWEGQCARVRQQTLCKLPARRMFSDYADPGPQDLSQLEQAIQNNDRPGTLVIMTKAQASRWRDHPAFANAFSKALLQFGEPFQRQAAAAGLPSDPIALQQRAIEAFPYAPAYWTTMAEIYAAKGLYAEAYFLFDVAFSLPMPDALAGPDMQAVKARLTQMRTTTLQLGL